MKELRLPLKRKWFDMTKAGIKCEYYRGITPYWVKRLAKTYIIYKGHLTFEPKHFDFCFDFAKVEQGDLILDTHGGSMSSVISALKNNLSITCCEIDKEYFMKAKKRIETYLSQGDMFAVKQDVKFIEP